MVLNKRLHVRSGNGKGVVETHGTRRTNQKDEKPKGKRHEPMIE